MRSIKRRHWCFTLYRMILYLVKSENWNHLEGQSRFYHHKVLFHFLSSGSTPPHWILTRIKSGEFQFHIWFTVIVSTKLVMDICKVFSVCTLRWWFLISKCFCGNFPFVSDGREQEVMLKRFLSLLAIPEIKVKFYKINNFFEISVPVTVRNSDKK